MELIGTDGTDNAPIKQELIADEALLCIISIEVTREGDINVMKTSNSPTLSTFKIPSSACHDNSFFISELKTTPYENWNYIGYSFKSHRT